jgi:hypothetical protein
LCDGGASVDSGEVLERPGRLLSKSRSQESLSELCVWIRS